MSQGVIQHHTNSIRIDNDHIMYGDALARQKVESILVTIEASTVFVWMWGSSVPQFSTVFQHNVLNSDVNGVEKSKSISITVTFTTINHGFCVIQVGSHYCNVPDAMEISQISLPIQCILSCSYVH